MVLRFKLASCFAVYSRRKSPLVGFSHDFPGLLLEGRNVAYRLPFDGHLCKRLG